MTSPTSNPQRVQKYFLVSVRRKGAKKHTTVSLSPCDFTQALGYVGGSAKTVRAAVRNVAESLDSVDLLPDNFSLIVRRKALARLRGSVRNATVQLAAENNSAWDY